MNITPARLGSQAGSGNPRCTIGLLTWNPGEELVATLESVLKQTEAVFDFIWVDNGSHRDYSAELERFPALPAPYRNPKNLGYCGGHNQLIAACKTQYYLALNQDAALDPAYIKTLCDWLDGDPSLALATGLTIQAGRVPPRVDFAGLVWTRLRHPFGLGHAAPVPPHPPEFRRASGVMGAALVMKLAACRAVSHPEHEIFPQDFFAYHEELELSQRLARAGYGCGVASVVRVNHIGGTSGGRKKLFIQTKIFANHWMITLRNDSLGMILSELPWLLWGEMRWWGKRYWKEPKAFFLALRDAIKRARHARRVYHAIEARHGPTAGRLKQVREQARRELSDPAIWKGPTP